MKPGFRFNTTFMTIKPRTKRSIDTILHDFEPRFDHSHENQALFLEALLDIRDIFDDMNTTFSEIENDLDTIAWYKSHPNAT